MAHELTWSFSLNNLRMPTTAADATAYFYWWIASALIGGTAWPGAPLSGRWTLYGSSDSLNAGIDSTDRLQLNGAYDIAKWVRNTAGNPHSWVVLQSPVLNGSQWYMLFDWASNTDSSGQIIMAKTAFSGGSVTASPTSPDEWGIPLGRVQVQLVASGVTTPFKMSMGMTSRGDFWALYYRLGQGTADNCLWVQAPTGTQASDQFPLFAYSRWNISGGTLHMNNLNNNACYTRQWNGSSGTNRQTVSAYLNGLPGPDFLSGKFPVVPLHIFCYDSTAGTVYRGRLQDCYGTSSYTSPITPRGATIIESGVMQYAGVGNVFLPCTAPLHQT